MWRSLLRSPLTWLLLALVVALVVALAGWGWSARSAAKAEGKVSTLQSDLKAVNDKAKEAEQREKLKDGAIDTLTGELDAQATAAATLQRQLGDLTITAATRADTIKRLKRENAELKEWADRPLPDPVIRLLQRPALTGAADYQAHLSGADPLPTAAGKPGQ
ncbi:Rz-like lysis system protein LysB [Aeromonas rivipollensis]|uniref:Rz-like lysis system protein LysB n=1 Tax=Aeromonas rivipollensis TaxID=948519 RepID=UPI00259DD6F2|nr:Rz-like lysis system protein LysB [Aeromonas rivipollensis]MDM5057598.1 Rz-like lysis system protein LysB [Aeromonas rivipollensis]